MEATPTAKSTPPPLLVDIGANLTNFRQVTYFVEQVASCTVQLTFKEQVSGSEAAS